LQAHDISASGTIQNEVMPNLHDAAGWHLHLCTDFRLRFDMRTPLIVQLAGTCMGLLLALSAVAQDKSATTTPTAAAEGAQSGMPGRDLRASKLIGQKIRNANGEDLGKIEDLIIDADAERIRYAVLEFGGTLGFGEKLFAYPISSFKPTGDNNQLVLNVDREKMKDAPGFARNKWPALADNRYRNEVDRYFGASNAGVTPPEERLMRASEVIGRSVSDRYGHMAGKVADLVVNPATERISYVVLDFERALGLNNKLVALPLGIFGFPERTDRNVVIDLTRDQINVARGFDNNAWPDLNAPAYRREMQAYLSRFHTEQTARPPSGTAGPETSSGR
jgi:sporulation protein YlmC with PRC-barrel domain